MSPFSAHPRIHLRPCVLGACALLLMGSGAWAEEGQLDRLRREVRSEAEEGPPRSSQEEGPGENGRWLRDSDLDETSATPTHWSVDLLLMGATSPVWLPRALVGDDSSAALDFSRFPYEDGAGYLCAGSPTARSWSGRLQAEYVEPFRDLTILRGRFLLDTDLRLGVDGQWDYSQERVSPSVQDHLWLGDLNIVWRFAQHANAEFRTGVGCNWLADDRRADFGFNFTYGFDLFPKRPWVLSTEIDWGTLGDAGLFRFRTTVGATFHGLEAYTGYEYFDVAGTHLNGLIGGVRLWF